MAKLASDIKQKYGGLDILVNNASVAFEFNEEPEQESPKILLKPEIQVELHQ